VKGAEMPPFYFGGWRLEFTRWYNKILDIRGKGRELMKIRRCVCIVILLSILPTAFCTSWPSYSQEQLAVHPPVNAGGVKYYTTISIVLPDKYQFIEIKTEPYIDIAHIAEYEMDYGMTEVVCYPAGILDYETTYSVDIGFRDNEGMPQNYSWKFTTFAAGSVGPEPFPYPKDDDAPRDAPISLYFHRFSGFRYADTIQGLEDDAELIMIPPVKIERVVAQVYGLMDTIVMFFPEEPLQPNTSYTAIFTTKQRKSCYTWRFNTSSMLHPATFPQTITRKMGNIGSITMQEAMDELKDELPLLNYLPNGYEVKEIYKSSKTPRDEPEYISRLLMIISDQDILWKDEYTFESKMTIDIYWRESEIDERELAPGELVTINGTQGSFIDAGDHYRLYWGIGAPSVSGKYLRIELRATKDLSKNELIEVANSIQFKKQNVLIRAFHTLITFLRDFWREVKSIF